MVGFSPGIKVKAAAYSLSSDESSEVVVSCDRFEGLVGKDDCPAIADAGRSFREALIRAGDNDRLAMLYQRAPLPTIPSDLVSGEESAERVRRTVDEHRHLVNALFRGDATRAQVFLRTHVAERHLVPICAV